jgi:hypothetical protein
MTFIKQYRTNAEDCLRLASSDQSGRDNPLWLMLAQSWLQLAEHAGRAHGGDKFEEPAPQRIRSQQ